MLVVVGYSDILLLDALKLMKEIAFTTAVVEQAHASATVMRCQHFMYQKEILCCRAFMHTLRTLFTQDETDIRTSKLAHRVHQIKNRQPQKVNLKALFMRDIFGSEGFSTSGVGTRYGSLSMAERLRYEEAAHHEQQRSMERLEAELEHIRAQQVLHDQRDAEMFRLRGNPMRLSSARLSSEELESLAAKVSGSEFKGQRLEHRRIASMQSPLVPTPQRMAELDLHSPPQPRAHTLPQWLRDLCAMRKHTAGAVIAVKSTESTFYYWTLFASLSPEVHEHNPPRAKKPKISDFTEEELELYPWLRDVVPQPETRMHAASSSGGNRRIPEDYDEDRLQEALDEFKRKKEEWDMKYSQEDHFGMMVKGGRWAQAVLNKSFHLVEAKARSEQVATWCQSNGINRLASFRALAMTPVLFLHKRTELEGLFLIRRYDCPLMVSWFLKGFSFCGRVGKNVTGHVSGH
eukprot:6490111-Amphidinium_carterae.1